MATLTQTLEALIERQIAKHGPDDPRIKPLQRQLAAVKANAGTSLRDLYMARPVTLEEVVDQIDSEMNGTPIDPIEDGGRVQELHEARPVTLQETVGNLDAEMTESIPHQFGKRTPPNSPGDPVNDD